MDDPYRNSDDGKCLVSEIEPGWTLEYYFVDHIMWVRETRNDCVLEQPIGDALWQDPFERAALFSGSSSRPRAQREGSYTYPDEKPCHNPQGGQGV